ncbi:Hypothetical protein, putative [Bodo saltans]|uniref:Uncharacterized protein n=1 Tax=Bodo saltans TaxID=75058 RepID=A0A0S4IW28_BODSA|nr:Hypothetical protein, putative [Bodo saltans]|eukprot:CUG05884.1 Hypothetical protein, putative [Bodo saltans]
MYLIVIATAVLLQRRESAAVVIAWTFRHAKVRRQNKDAIRGKSLSHAVQMQVSASNLHDRCKSFVRMRNAAYHYVREYDKMISEVTETKFLDVFSANKDKSSAHLLAYEKKKHQEYLSTLQSESPLSFAVREDLKHAVVVSGDSVRPTGVVLVTNQQEPAELSMTQCSIDASVGVQSSFDDSMVEAQLSFSAPPILIERPTTSSFDEAVARRVEAKLARLSSLFLHLTTDVRRAQFHSAAAVYCASEN